MPKCMKTFAGKMVPEQDFKTILKVDRYIRPPLFCIGTVPQFLTDCPQCGTVLSSWAHSLPINHNNDNIASLLNIENKDIRNKDGENNDVDWRIWLASTKNSKEFIVCALLRSSKLQTSLQIARCSAKPRTDSSGGYKWVSDATSVRQLGEESITEHHRSLQHPDSEVCIGAGNKKFESCFCFVFSGR